MIIHGYNSQGSIDATIDEVRVTVPDDMANSHRLMIAEWERAGNTIPPYVEPTPPYQTPAPQLTCVATFDYNDFDISGIQNGAGMSTAFMIDVGKMWLFFETPMPDNTYPWNVSSSVGKINVSDRQAEYIEITVTDDQGNPVPAAAVSVQIFKVN